MADETMPDGYKLVEYTYPCHNPHCDLPKPHEHVGQGVVFDPDHRVGTPCPPKPAGYCPMCPQDGSRCIVCDPIQPADR